MSLSVVDARLCFQEQAHVPRSLPHKSIKVDDIVMKLQAERHAIIVWIFDLVPILVSHRLPVITRALRDPHIGDI